MKQKPSASKSQLNLKSVNGNNPISVAHLQNPDIWTVWFNAEQKCLLDNNYKVQLNKVAAEIFMILFIK